VIERKYIGGSCPNIACLPSKNIVHSAKVASYYPIPRCVTPFWLTRPFWKGLTRCSRPYLLGRTQSMRITDRRTDIVDRVVGKEGDRREITTLRELKAYAYWHHYFIGSKNFVPLMSIDRLSGES
jgi:hypothetical protein